MPAKVKVRILAGRNLPIMDRASDTSDAYVEVKLGNTTFKTEVCRRSLNPQWNSEWFKFEVDDEELQDEPLQVRIMDYDTYSANDAIGKVYIDLNPLLNKETGPLMSGWFPIFDTMHGLRGEVNAVVKVDLFSDSNKYRESSCGVLFFYSQGVPYGYKAQEILGFVEELVVNDDPEYQWIDKIRTPRASNEARQTLFSKLSGEVQRKIGLKALDLGGNAVISYHQYFDLEGESGIVVRGIGTAVRLVRLVEGLYQTHQTMSPPREALGESPVADDANSNVQGSVSPKTQQSPAKTVAGVNVGIGTRRSSDPDLSTPPKGTVLSSSAGASGGKVPVHRPNVNQESLDMLEYPFITMKSFPAHVIQHLGGVVSARSVKLLDQINNPDDPETRDAWWTELRKEIRSHTRSLGCNVVLGYTETTSFCDDICVLSASGTAAILSQSVDHESSGASAVLSHSASSRPSSGDRQEKENSKESKSKPLSVDINLANHPGKSLTDWTDDIMNCQVCSLCHIPYSESSVPFSSNLVLCAICRRSKVPDVLFMTIEPPPGIPITGKGCFIQSRVFRQKRDSKGEQNAKDISDSLPFLEYELHKQLLTKLKVKGMNGLFGLRVQVSVGERMLIGVATGTGAYLSPLPQPSIPKITCAKGAGEARICEIQKLVQETITRNKECYDLMCTDNIQDISFNGKVEDGELSEDDLPEIDLSVGNKDTFILEVDDADVDILSLLNDPKPPDGFELCNTEKLPGLDNYVCNIQMFTRVYRTKLSCLGQSNRQVAQHFEYFLQSLFVKLRRMTPCCISSLYFNVELPDQDEMQISAYGIAVGLGEPGLLATATGRFTRHRVKHNSLPHVGPEADSDLLFSIDDEKQGTSQAVQDRCGFRTSTGMTMSHSAEGRFHYHSPFREQSGIELTPLSFVPGGRIEHYLGNLDFFFIRECTSIRENGGLNGFIQTFISEVLAIARAHVAALGGNALVAFQKTHCILLYNPHKNQGQCLVNVAGDAVSVLYSTLHHSSGSETQYSEGE